MYTCDESTGLYQYEQNGVIGHGMSPDRAYEDWLVALYDAIESWQ